MIGLLRNLNRKEIEMDKKIPMKFTYEWWAEVEKIQKGRPAGKYPKDCVVLTEFECRERVCYALDIEKKRKEN